jgi:hypothetical protein
MMSEDDKQVFSQARPFIVGIVALVFQLRTLGAPNGSFDQAEEFVQEFEKRNT